MSFFEDRFKNHAVHEALTQCLDEIKSYEFEEIEEEEVIAINRCEHVLKFAKTMLNRCDADLVNTTSLDQLNSAVTSVLQHWEEFTQNRNWNAITGPCDNLLTHIAQLSSKQKPIPKSYSDLLGSLRDNTEEMLQQIRLAKERQDEEIDALESRLENCTQEIQTHESEVEKQKTRMDSLINQQQETFSTAQDTRSKEFSDFVSEKETAFEENQTEQEAEFETLHQQQTKTGQEQLDELQAHSEHAKEIIGIIGNIGVTGNYQKNANQEKTYANWFRNIAVTFFTTAVIAGGVVLWLSTTSDNFTWDMGLFKLITAIAFAVPGIYCASESSKHRKKEQESRKLELELASISPFLEKLNDENKATEILEKLAPEYFGSHATSSDGSPVLNLDPTAVAAALKPIIELTKALK